MARSLDLSSLGPSQTAIEKFEKSVFTLKWHQMFSDHTQNQSPAILDLHLRKTQEGKSRDYRDVIVFEKLRFQSVSRPH